MAETVCSHVAPRKQTGFLARIVPNAMYFAARLVTRWGIVSLWLSFLAFVMWPSNALIFLESYGLASALLFEVERFRDRKLLRAWWYGRG